MLKRNFRHMTREQRCQIQELLSMGKTQREIAEEIEVNQSSISREIARNSIGYSYDFKISDGISVWRRSSAIKIPKRMNLFSRTLPTIYFIIY
jgi:IS30 family transposase